MIREAIEQGNGLDKLEPILACMHELGSLKYTQQRAEQESEKAIACLSVVPDSDYKDALVALAHLAVKRTK